MTARVLVAGIGNIFFSDDGFGPAVVALLAREPIGGARIHDFGIGVVHLAYALLDGYDAVVIVDAVARGGPPGTLYVIEHDDAGECSEPNEADAHRMDLSSVFAFVRRLDGVLPPVTVVGCEPESLEEGGDLSVTVTQAVETAVPLVRRVVNELLATPEGRLCTEA
jgi:hydrogenase maturation protease